MQRPLKWLYFKECEELKPWSRAIIKHSWWGYRSCNGDVLRLKEKWVSISYHVKNTYCWGDHSIFKKCQHPLLMKAKRREKPWFNENSNAYNTLVAVVRVKSLFKDLHYFESVRHAGSIVVFHSLCNKYCPKRLHFSFHGMIVRTQLACHDYIISIGLLKVEIKSQKKMFQGKAFRND